MKMNRKVVRSVICVLLALIFVISLMTALIPTNASAASQSEINRLTQQRKELQAKQKEQQKTINSLRSKKASVVDQKAALDQENDLAQQEIELVKEQITAYDQQIEDKGVELEAAKQEEEAQTVRFRSCVRHLEEYGQMSYIAILLEATSLSDLLARMDMVGEVIAYNKQVQADMTAAREKVETVKAELEDARTEMQDKQSELETKQVALQQKVSEANALLASLESDINAYKSVYDQYEQQQKNVQSQIDKQVADLRRQEEANKNNNPGYDPGKANGSTGTMMWPCPSCHYITSQFGWRYHPIYQTQKYHSGVDIGASYGRLRVRLWQLRRHQPWQRHHHALRPHELHCGVRRPEGLQGPDDRLCRLDRQLHRPASALGSHGQRRAPEPAQLCELIGHILTE